MSLRISITSLLVAQLMSPAFAESVEEIALGGPAKQYPRLKVGEAICTPKVFCGFGAGRRSLNAQVLNVDLVPAAIDLWAMIDPSVSFAGKSMPRFDNLVPYQASPIFGRNVISATYNSLYDSYRNVFQNASYAKATGLAPIVAQFGEGNAAGAVAKAWGGNFVGVTSASGGTSIGAEINSDNMVSDGKAYGLVLASAGNFQSRNAVQIQANNEVSRFKDGINFNSTTVSSAISDTAIKMVDLKASYGINALGASFSTAEIEFPSFVVGATRFMNNSKIAISGSANSDPIIAAAGIGSAPVHNVNLNLQSAGTGSVRVAVNGAIGLAVNAGPGIGNSGVSISTSDNGNPTIAASEAGNNPAKTADLNLSALGNGLVRTAGDHHVTGSLRHSVSAEVIAAGSSQMDAESLTTDINVVTKVPSATGVVLKSGQIGVRQEVFNRGANGLLVYPPRGARIEGNATDSAILLAVGGHATFECVLETQCYQAP